MGVNHAANLSGTAGDVSTMFFGSVSGGLSAKLSGGNFWQGAAIGLVVSGLNHVMHRSDDLGDCPTCPKKAKVGDTYVDSDGSNWSYTSSNGWTEMQLVYIKTEPIALGSGGMIEYIGGGGPVKGVQWLTKMVKKYPGSATTATQIGEKYWKYTVEVAGKNGSTVYTKYLNLQGKTVQWFHDTYNSANKFMHREFNAVGGRLKVWWDGAREYIQK